jgi:hypothetical protein
LRSRGIRPDQASRWCLISAKGGSWYGLSFNSPSRNSS